MGSRRRGRVGRTAFERLFGEPVREEPLTVELDPGLGGPGGVDPDPEPDAREPQAEGAR